MATIKSKVIVNVIILLLAIIGIIGMEASSISNLGDLQDEGAKRAHDAVIVTDASMGGLELYQVIADAVINRDLDKAAKDWAEIKAEVLKDSDMIIKLADTPEEKKLAEEVKVAVQEIVSIFENKMLPVLKTSDGITAEIRDLDGKIDIQVGKIKAGMDKVVASLEKEMSSADEQFDAERKAAIYEALAIGIVGILLQIGLAGLPIQPKRRNLPKR